MKLSWRDVSAGLVLALFAGCSNAQADLHAASLAAVGILTVAASNPALLAEATDAVTLLGGKVLTPVDQALLAQALSHVTAGNAGAAAAVLAPVVAASAPAPSTP